jgi:acyl-CoA synthetase (AMP-forming)/AMP-acid ligase II
MTTTDLVPLGQPAHPAAWAAADPDRPALVMARSGATRTYRELDEASTRLARLLRARGLQRDDHLAVLIENRPEFFEAVWAGLRAGLHVTLVNWHLSPAEAGYIIANCEARALVTSAALGPVVAELADDLAAVEVRLAVDDGVPEFEDYAAALAHQPGSGPVPDEAEGSFMFYSSGTTGRPKGILAPLPQIPFGAPFPFALLLTGVFGFTPESVYLSPSPLYHAAPAGWTTTVHRIGGTVVAMERFDPIELLAYVERYRVTHMQLVPTHMVRLLKLPEEDRRRFDLSSLQMIVHAAAPCPVEVKRATIDWLGPIVHEYYAGSEGTGFCIIGPEDWLAHPGSVGKSLLGTIHILDDEGAEQPVGEEGGVWFETSRHFVYHGDAEKTAQAWNDRGWNSLGDVGRLDADGYLYLTDRASNMIISGGVNIYPREVEDHLVVHPAVADVAVLGTPDPDWGEQVTAFVQLLPGVEPSDELAEALIEHCRDRLSHFKCPRSVRFVDDLPRLPTGKLLKRLLVVE